VVKPRAREKDLVVEELGDELLVYDLETSSAHCLGATASRVWRACDGESDVAALGATLGLEAETVEAALVQLQECSLLDTSAPAGITRRELHFKVAKVGAVAAAAPFIVSLAVPAVAAATPTVEECRAGFTGGCGDCKLKGCCCCGPGGGSTKDCVPTATCGKIAYPLAPIGSECSKTT
jgi:hypothetical protein